MTTEGSFGPERAGNWIYDNLECGMTPSGMLKLKGSQCRNDEKAWERIRYDLEGEMRRLQAFDYFMEGEEGQRDYRYNTMKTIRHRIAQSRQDKEDQRLETLTDSGFDLNNLQLVTVLGEKDSLVCVDTSTDTLIHPSEFDISNFRVLAPDQFKQAFERVGMCALKYDPTKPDRWDEPWIIGEGSIPNLTHYNLHVTPPWRRMDPDPLETLFLPPQIEKIMSHMVMGDSAQLEYLYDAVHFIIKERLHVYLVLSGSPGIGKGFFGTMITQLLGDVNVKDAPKGALKSSFNDLFSETRLVIHDEYPAATREEIASLKKNIENKQSIQRKFKDAKNLEKIWASQLITVNKGIRYAFEPNERKFSVLDLNNVPLLEIMSETEINEVTNRIAKDPEYLAKIGFFFLQRKPKASPRVPLRGKRFWQMVVAGLTGFNRFLYSTLREKYDKEILLNHVFRMFADSRKGIRYEEPTEEEVLAHLEMWTLAGKPIAKVYQKEGKVVLRSTIEPSVLQDVETAEAEAYSDDDLDFGFEHL
jgi:hypothetical protein